MVFFIPAGGKGLICGAGSARSRRGRHTLRCRCIPARCGRRPTLSSPPLSARAQAHAVLPKAVEAGTDGRATALRRRSGPTTRSLRWRSSSKGDLICAAFLLRPFRCGPTFPAKIEKRSKEKSAAHVRALKNRTGHYPPRNSRAKSFQLIQNGL